MCCSVLVLKCVCVCVQCDCLCAVEESIKCQQIICVKLYLFRMNIFVFGNNYVLCVVCYVSVLCRVEYCCRLYTCCSDIVRGANLRRPCCVAFMLVGEDS